MNVTGGLVYHWRALKYSSSLWKSYHKNIAEWLAEWPQKNERLLLVGPSAGYSLTNEFLSRYKKIVVNELDSCARYLFKKKFYKSDIDFIKTDLLGTTRDLVPDQFITYINSNLSCDILFANVLGQISILTANNPEKFISWSSKLKKGIQSKNFASYHDLFSFKGSYRWKSESILCDGAVEEDRLVREFIDSDSLTQIELMDHWTQNLMSLGRRRVLHWEIAPKQHHLIECVVNF